MSAPIDKLAMPKWGLSMTEGHLLEWLVEEGAEIGVGEEVAAVETDKLNGVIESPVAGVLRRRVASPGEVIPVGGLLGVVADTSVADGEIEAFIVEFQTSFVPGEDDESAATEPEAVEVAAGSLRFLRQGEQGEAIVLLHGFGGDLGNWLFTTPALAEKHTVYALDLPGHGGSTKQVGSGDLDALVTTVEQFLDSQEVGRVHLVGHSMGGLVASALALRSPQRVASLTLVGSAGLGEEINDSYLDGFISAQGRRELKPALELLFADPSLLTRRLVDDVLKYKRIDGVSDALRTLSAQLFPGGHQHEVLAARLAALDLPMLVVWGAQDRIIPAEHARNAPAGAQVHVFESIGHSPHMEAAGEFNRLLERFLASINGA
jgi:pyruvate dehydrogenase E2 component (dihydrolipoyllysine-residue acetyltransferase)